MTTVTIRTQQPTNPMAAFVKSNMQFVMVFIALVTVYVYFIFAAPNFVQAKIFTDILLQITYIDVMTLGATSIITTASIDLSVGTGMTLVAVMASVFLSIDWMNLPLGAGLILVLLFGAFVGLINGVNISILDLPPFIAMLTTMMVARGLVLIISDKLTIPIVNKSYIALSTGSLFLTVGGATLASAVLIFVLLTILVASLLSETLLGRYALAIGSNEKATRLSGVNVRLWKVIIYAVAGAFMAIGAILYSACFGFIQPAEGVGFELNVIATTVTGGTSLSGGRVSIPGAPPGALIMETLRKGLTMMGAAFGRQLVVIDVAVLPTVFINNTR